MKLEPPTVTSDDVLTAIKVLEQMPRVLEQARVNENVTFYEVSTNLSVADSMIRGVVAGRSPQGMTTLSLLKVLPWVAQALSTEASTTA